MATQSYMKNTRCFIENNIHRLYCCHNRNVCLCAHGQNLSKHWILIYMKVINEAKRRTTMWFWRKCVSDILRAYQTRDKWHEWLKMFILCVFFFLFVRPDTNIESILCLLQTRIPSNVHSYFENFSLCWREIKQMLPTESCPILLMNPH